MVPERPWQKYDHVGRRAYSYADVASTPEGIVSHVMARAGPGSMVLLHEMYPSRLTSMQAVRGIVRSLRARGYELVTVSELLGR